MRVDREELDRFNISMERLCTKTEEMLVEADQEGSVSVSLNSEQIQALLCLFEAHSEAVNNLFYAKNNLKQLEEMFHQLIPTDEFLNKLGD